MDRTIELDAIKPSALGLIDGVIKKSSGLVHKPCWTHPAQSAIRVENYRFKSLLAAPSYQHVVVTQRRIVCPGLQNRWMIETAGMSKVFCRDRRVCLLGGAIIEMIG